MSDPVEPDCLPGAPHPRETAGLYGQDAAEAQFLAAAGAGRLHHAWLLTGPRGVGKATLAWRIARALVAGGPVTTLQMDPGAPAFRTLAGLASPRLFLCRRPWDDKAERLRVAITVEEVRALKEFFQLSATDGGHRVAIVDAADELNASAANALLKILEEPPADAVLLLVCHRPAGLLPTIRSRCRELRLGPLGPADMHRALAGAGAEVDASAALATLAGGSVGAAMRLAGENGAAIYEAITGLLRQTPLDRRGALALADGATGRDAAGRYELTLELIGTALGRLALAGAGAPVEPVSTAEAEMLARLGASPAHAQVWARLAPAIAARTAHARAVNLDPGQVILDTLLQIDAAAAEARALAA
ncbi:MAG: DNA polymerase III subunit delta' [Amaricoccus sp.]|uniref:DNA polymerase III subunit delta' n=1 Tax=Amaricoccus sp. TaxID=1872485 RepID=UPI0039E2B639